MEKDANILIAGASGLVGSAVVRKLHQSGYSNLLTPSHREVDLVEQSQVRSYFEKNRVDYVILAAAKVGGILFNQRYQAEFLYDNLMISANVIEAAYRSGTKKLLYLGSSCIYPKLAPQPIREDSLLSGPLEPTNEGYALAKIAGLKLCEKYYTQHGRKFVSVMPTNLYGPGDNFHPEHSHVIPGMMRRFHDAKLKGLGEVVIWGTGKPMREFLHVDDLANAVEVLMNCYDDPQTINVGTGVDCTIQELAVTMRDVVGFKGEITFDTTKPDGTPRKVLDVSRMRALGWSPKYSLKEGLANTYAWALAEKKFA